MGTGARVDGMRPSCCNAHSPRPVEAMQKETLFTPKFPKSMIALSVWHRVESAVFPGGGGGG